MNMDTGNSSISSAIKFAMQGLNTLCEILPLEEMLKCRLICRSWEMFISNHSRFTQTTTKFHENIYSVSGESLQTAIKRQIYWRRVHLEFFPFTRKTNLISYWRICGEFVHTLHLKTLNVNCMNLVMFLNECPSVVEITFDDNGFRPRYPKERVNNKKIAIVCSHKKPPVRKSSPFTSVTFSNQNVIPLCILDYIILRSQGKLKNFTFEHATCNSAVRMLLYPTKSEVEDRILELIRINADNLKTLTVVNCNEAGDFLNRVAQIENLNLNELNFDPFRLPSKTREMHPSFGLNLLQSQLGKSVAVLKIGFHEPDGARLQEMLTNFSTTNLKQLKIVVAKGYVDIRPMLCKLDNLTSLEIEEFGHCWRNIFPLQPNDDPIRGINPNYLTTLPSSLRSLTITHKAKRDNITQLLLQNTKTIFLQHLKIDYSDINDQMCQEIISSFPLLETLHIRNSKMLTDVGVTGMDANTCKYLRKNHHVEEVKDFLEQFSISNLKNLRTLSFYGCSKISDVSIVYGVKLEKLRFLDVSFCKHVTETGIISAITNNLDLERLILYDLIMSTNSVNNLMAVNKKLKNVHLSKDTLLKQRAKYETKATLTEMLLMNKMFTDEPFTV